MLTFQERLSHNALAKNRKRETLDACIQSTWGNSVTADELSKCQSFEEHLSINKQFLQFNGGAFQ